MLETLRSELKLASRFAITGGSATFAHAATSSLLLWLTELSLQTVNFAGFIVAVWVSYLGHYHFSFRSAKAHRVALPRFLTATLIAYGCNVGVIFLTATLAALPDYVSLLCGIAIMPVASFVLSRFWVY